MDKLQKTFPTIWPIFITIPTFLLIGLLSLVLVVGCVDNAKVNTEVAKNASIGENAKNLLNIEKIYSDGPLGTANITGNKVADKVADKIIDTSNQDQFKLAIEELKGDIKELKQTNNTGFMSGGAPWLFMVILALLYGRKHVQHNRVKKEARKQRETVIALEDTLNTLSNKMDSEARIQSKLDILRNGNEEKQE